MLYPSCPIIIGMAAGFEDVIKTNEIALDVRIRVGDGVTHTSLRCKIHNHLRLVFLKNLGNNCLISNAALYENKRRMSRQFFKPCLL